MKREFNPAISFIRVIAMFSIIAGHVCTAYRINTFQLGSIGVEIFLFISGYLYGKYKTDSWIKWGRVRWKRLIPPLWWTTTICVLVGLLFDYIPDWRIILTYGLNLQGADRILHFVFTPTLKGMGHTWFVTVIAICYMLMIALKKSEKLEKWIDENTTVALIIAVFVQIGLCFTGVQLSYLLQFFIGYFIVRKTKNQNDWINNRYFLVVTIITIVLSIIRLVARKYIDGSTFYDMILARLSFNALAVWLVMVMTKLADINAVKKIIRSKVWQILDMSSYHLFLTHYMFLTGVMSVKEWIQGDFLQVLVFTITTIISSAIILILTEYNSLLKLVKRR